MIFTSFALSRKTIISATAKGHPDEVVRAFREACTIVFGDSTPWRITEVNGCCLLEMRFDSDMEWVLRAERKEIKI